jgi:transposase
LPRAHVTIEPDDTKCSCCQAPMHVIGEETSQRLDVIPAQYRVIVTHRPNMPAGPVSRRWWRRQRLNG